MNFKNKIILVDGSSGSWGTELITQLLEKGVKEVRGLARGEFNQVTLERKFNDSRLKIIIGDVRDYGKVKWACKDVDYVFHLSAMKHVPICEDFPYEAIKTNINGTRNVVRAAIDNNVKLVVDVSTDKAVEPINTYGMTKAIGEKLTLNASKLNSKTKFMVVRGGNVLGTAGSVVPFWIDQIKRFNKVTITDENMTRYFLTLPEAIKLLFVAMRSQRNRGLFVMNMPACRITDLAKVVIKYYGNKSTKIEVTGIRPGEKLDEVLISKHEVHQAYEYGKDYYLINLDADKTIKKLKKVTFKEFNSAENLMDDKEIEELLRKGGYLK